MTRDEFLASKRWCDNLGAELPDECWNRDDPPQAGYLYASQFHIEQVTACWPQFARNRGAWYLLLGNMEYIDNDLAKLEGILYAYARAEMGWDDERSIYAYFVARLKADPQDDTLRDLPIDSKCGEDCKAAIDAAAAYLRAADPSPAVVTPALESVRRTISVFWHG